MKKVATSVLKAGLLDALFNSDKYIDVLERVESKTDMMATMFEEAEDRIKEIADGKSDSVH